MVEYREVRACPDPARCPRGMGVNDPIQCFLARKVSIINWICITHSSQPRQRHVSPAYGVKNKINDDLWNLGIFVNATVFI